MLAISNDYNGLGIVSSWETWGGAGPEIELLCTGTLVEDISSGLGTARDVATLPLYGGI